MKWVYYEWEDRRYRAPVERPLAMEILIGGEWRPYAGDPARVVYEGHRLAEPDVRK